MKVTGSTIRVLLSLAALLASVNCSDGSGAGTFVDPSTIAVDSTNDRLFTIQARGEVLAFEASSLDDLTDAQPAISEDDEEDIHDSMPEIVSQFGVFSTGGTSRLLFMGMLFDDDAQALFNRVQVLDYNGASFSFASFSPIVIDDQDGVDNDETNNTFADLVVDQDNARIYITDATDGLLHIYSANDGTMVQAPVAIGGAPSGLWLDGGFLYVCNASTVAAEQVISRIDVTDFSEDEIDLDISCDEIAVANNTTGTVLMARDIASGEVLIRSLNSDTLAVAEIPVDPSSDASDGRLSAGSGITSVVNDIVITKDSSGSIFAYFSQADGNVGFVSVSSDLSEFALTTVSTLSLDLNEGALLIDGGFGSSVFFIAGSGALVEVPVGTDDADLTS